MYAHAMRSFDEVLRQLSLETSDEACNKNGGGRLQLFKRILRLILSNFFDHSAKASSA